MIKAAISKIKNDFKTKNDSSPLSKEDYLQAYEKKIENEIKIIVPEYKGIENIKKMVEEVL